MFKLCLLILLLVPGYFSQLYNVQKIWLFSQAQYGGNVPVDKNGKQVQNYSLQLKCYIETGKNQQMANWQQAYLNGNKYKVTILPIDLDSVLVGIKINTRSPIFLKPNVHTKLVQLELTLVGRSGKSNKAKFELEGIINKKHVSFYSNEPLIELSPLLMP